MVQEKARQTWEHPGSHYVWELRAIMIERSHREAGWPSLRDLSDRQGMGEVETKATTNDGATCKSLELQTDLVSARVRSEVPPDSKSFAELSNGYTYPFPSPSSPPQHIKERDGEELNPPLLQLPSLGLKLEVYRDLRFLTAECNEKSLGTCHLLG